MTTVLQNAMIKAIALSEYQPINGAMPEQFSDLDWVSVPHFTSVVN